MVDHRGDRVGHVHRVHARDALAACAPPVDATRVARLVPFVCHRCHRCHRVLRPQQRRAIFAPRPIRLSASCNFFSVSALISRYFRGRFTTPPLLVPGGPVAVRGAKPSSSLKPVYLSQMFYGRMRLRVEVVHKLCRPEDKHPPLNSRQRACGPFRLVL